MQRRDLLTLLAAAAGGLPARGALAQGQPVRLLVGATPGGGTDLVARALAQEMTRTLGRQVIVENRPGAAGNIAAQATATASPDGSTLLLSYTSHAINASLYPSLPFDPVKDFTPLFGVASAPAVLVARSDLPAKDLPELIALAKSRPGKLNIAIAGIGGANHLAGEMLKRSAGIDIASIPYKGTGPALADTMSGQIDLTFSGMASAQELLKGGRLKALGVSSGKRLPLYPQIPAIAETLPGFEYSAWYGLFGPAKMPAALVAQYAQAAREALDAPAVRQRLASESLVALNLPPAEFDRFVRSEIVRWGKVVAATGAKPE
jgi:tripartite-type tricarboxylate transporter receptor subunit TctC